jgi:hypothetical protein
MQINITEAVVLLSDFADSVALHTDLPSTMPAICSQPLILKFEVEHNCGVDYVRKHFGIEPTMIKRI